MLTEPLIQQLQDLRLRGMAAALAQQAGSRDTLSLPFDERLSLLIQHELTERASARLAQRLPRPRRLRRSCRESRAASWRDR